MSDEIRKYHRNEVKGHVRSYVEGKSQSLDKTVKMIRTKCKNYNISEQELRSILIQVEREAVEPYLKQPKHSKLYQPERLVRFKEVCRRLGIDID